MQHRLMILGSMDEFVDLVTLARSKGIYTIVCDGYTDGPAKSFADASFDIDVRETDAIAKLCVEQRVDGIIASYSDLLAECMVTIADKAGLPCYAKPEQFRYLREKKLMKDMFRELGINAPSSVAVHRNSIAQDIASIGFPCVVKPVNGYGSRGIFILNSVEEIEERFDEITSYSTFDYIMAEEYCNSREFNMMNWIVDGEVKTISLADRETSSEFAWVIPHVSRCAYPSVCLDEVLDEAREIVRKVAHYVGIETGPLSMQFFYAPETGVQVCEVAGRLFGYEHELVTLACGLSVEALLLDQVYDIASLKRRLEHHSPRHPACSAGLYFHGYSGVVSDISSVMASAADPRVENVSIYYQPGDVIEHDVGSKPYVVRFYVKAGDRASLDDVTAKLFDSVKILDPDGKNLLYSNQVSRFSSAQ